MFSLKNLKSLSQRKKDTVFGYIHEMEKKLQIGNVPQLISYKCLAYSKEEDYFTGSSVELTNRRKTATFHESSLYDRRRIIGKNAIDSRHPIIVKWKIQIENVDDNKALLFGILEGTNKKKMLISTNGKMKSDWWDQGVEDYVDPDDWVMDTGDVITVILDLIDYTIKMKVEGVDEEAMELTKISRDETKYRFMAYLTDNTSITIIDHSIH